MMLEAQEARRDSHYRVRHHVMVLARLPRGRHIVRYHVEFIAACASPPCLACRFVLSREWLYVARPPTRAIRVHSLQLQSRAPFA